MTFLLYGRTFASASLDHTVRLWKMASGKIIAIFSGHDRDVYSIAYSPDGRTLANGSWDNSVILGNLDFFYVNEQVLE